MVAVHKDICASLYLTSDFANCVPLSDSSAYIYRVREEEEDGAAMECLEKKVSLALKTHCWHSLDSQLGWRLPVHHLGWCSLVSLITQPSLFDLRYGSFLIQDNKQTHSEAAAQDNFYECSIDPRPTPNPPILRCSWKLTCPADPWTTFKLKFPVSEADAKADRFANFRKWRRVSPAQGLQTYCSEISYGTMRGNHRGKCHENFGAILLSHRKWGLLDMWKTKLWCFQTWYNTGHESFEKDGSNNVMLADFFHNDCLDHVLFRVFLYF